MYCIYLVSSVRIDSDKKNRGQNGHITPTREMLLKLWYQRPTMCFLFIVNFIWKTFNLKLR